jgi:hypothetical protein
VNGFAVLWRLLMATDAVDLHLLTTAPGSDVASIHAGSPYAEQAR